MKSGSAQLLAAPVDVADRAGAEGDARQITLQPYWIFSPC